MMKRSEAHGNFKLAPLSKQPVLLPLSPPPHKPTLPTNPLRLSPLKNTPLLPLNIGKSFPERVPLFRAEKPDTKLDTKPLTILEAFRVFTIPKKKTEDSVTSQTTFSI